MKEKTLAIQTPEGSMETFVAHPDAEGPFPVVVVYMDAPGIREELLGFARRIAGEGYYAVLPDLYYRRGRVRLDLSAEGVRAEMFAHMRSLSNEGVTSDTRAVLDVLASESRASDGPKGCIGYCMSGQFVMTVAGRLPNHFRASVSCYGVAIVTDAADSPHRLADRVRGEIFFAFAEKDEYVPPATIDTLSDALEAAGVAHRVDVYPGTQHGFCFPERAGSYHEDAAEDVWRRTFAMFARQLH